MELGILLTSFVAGNNLGKGKIRFKKCDDEI
jgi:hypothetical protein